MLIRLCRLRRLLSLLGRDALTLWYACRHPSAPWALRLGAAGFALYLLSPLDMVPDWLPLLGWLDDVGVAAILIPALLKLLPMPAMVETRAATENFLSRWRPHQRR